MDWQAMVLLGAYHGINPGMGWLFAVALGMQQRQRARCVACAAADRARSRGGRRPWSCWPRRWRARRAARRAEESSSPRC